MTTIIRPIRVFKMGTIRLQDPDPMLEPDAVRTLYADSYPHLAAASINGPTVTASNELEFVFEPPAVKTKGGEAVETISIPKADMDAACNGEIPDWESPLMGVHQHGAQYAVQMLAEILGVKDYAPGDGSETYDGDLRAELSSVLSHAAGCPNDDFKVVPENVVSQSQQYANFVKRAELFDRELADLDAAADTGDLIAATTSNTKLRALLFGAEKKLRAAATIIAGWREKE